MKVNMFQETANEYCFFFRELIKPDRDSKGQHLTMNQFRRLFSTCRIPAVQRDHLKAYFKTGKFLVLDIMGHFKPFSFSHYIHLQPFML